MAGRAGEQVEKRGDNMRIASFIKFYLILTAFLFIFYSYYPADLWSKIFLFLALTIFSPYLFKLVVEFRGVKRGDTVLAAISKKTMFGFNIQKLPAKALSGGKVGDVIEVEFGSARASGEIRSMGGIIFPAEVNILYYGSYGEHDVIDVSAGE